MGGFAETMLARVPAGLEVPGPIRLLYQWVEDNGFVTESADGDVYGTLSSDDTLGPGTDIWLRGDTARQAASLAEWFVSGDDSRPLVWSFCQTGGDGSLAALWRHPDGLTRVVHIGSGSGSLLTCVLGADAVDFLRLLAIGYDEICWNEDWSAPPRPEDGRPVDNVPYRRWVETTFSVSVPATGLDVIPHPAEMGDDDSDDPWCALWSAHHLSAERSNA